MGNSATNFGNHFVLLSPYTEHKSWDVGIIWLQTSNFKQFQICLLSPFRKAYFRYYTWLVLVLSFVQWLNYQHWFDHLYIININKGCTREFLYIRNSLPRLKLTSWARNWPARMKVYTHSSPLRTQKLLKLHEFLSRLALTSRGGEWLNSKLRTFVNWFIHDNEEEDEEAEGGRFPNARQCWVKERGFTSRKRSNEGILNCHLS